MAHKKITLATIKAFARKNQNSLFVKHLSSFDGMQDMVDFIKNPIWSKVSLEDSLGTLRGVWLVRESRDYFRTYQDDTYLGFEISNSCGSAILATLKSNISNS